MMMLLAWAGLLLTAVPAWAAGAEAGHDDGSGMLTVDLWQAGYTITVFLLLVGVLGKFAFKPILGGLQSRENFIRGSIEQAKKDREQAEARLKEYEAKIQLAHEESARIIEQGRRDAEAARKRAEEEARASSDAMVDRARREIEAARDSAVRDLYEQSADLAASLAVSALRREVSPEEHQRLMLDALRELGQHARQN